MPPTYSDAVLRDSSLNSTAQFSSVAQVSSGHDLCHFDVEKACNCSRGSLTGGRHEVWWSFDLGVDPVDAHPLLTLSVRLQAVLTAGRAFVALQMAVSTRQTAGAGSRRLARLALWLGGRCVLRDGILVLDIALTNVLLL